MCAFDFVINSCCARMHMCIHDVCVSMYGPIQRLASEVLAVEKSYYHVYQVCSPCVHVVHDAHTNYAAALHSVCID